MRLYRIDPRKAAFWLAVLAAAVVWAVVLVMQARKVG